MHGSNPALQPDRFVCRRCATLVVIGTEEAKRSPDVREQFDARLCTSHWREQAKGAVTDFVFSLAVVCAGPILIATFFLR